MCVPFTLPIKSLPSVRFFCFVLFFKIKRKKKNRHGHIKLILKGYFTQKWKFWHHLHLLSSFKSVWVSLFCRTQGKIFWRKFVTRLFWGTIDFHSRKKKYYWSQWCPRTALFPTFFRISSFVFSRTKKLIQVWNYLRVSKWWQNFHFWVNYPFNNKVTKNPEVNVSVSQKINK